MSQPLSMTGAEDAAVLVRLIESSAAVRRRYQFFVWSQSQLHQLLPHRLLVCGVYLRQQRQVSFDSLHSLVLSAPTLASLAEADAPLSRALAQAWSLHGGQPLLQRLDNLGGPLGADAGRLAAELGSAEVLVHGVTRPQRPQEIETLFLLGGHRYVSQHLVYLDLLLPQLHRTWQRVVATELELQRPPLTLAGSRTVARTPSAAGPSAATAGAARAAQVTARERQILAWVREGSSNQSIAAALSISPLTVKNHVQKILRKLDASNRAQAVARAMAEGLIPPSGHPDSPDEPNSP